MAIMSVSTPKVKTYLKPRTVPPRHHFGEGVLASRPSYRVDYTAEDAIWAAEHLDSGEDSHWDAEAILAAFAERYERGCVGI